MNLSSCGRRLLVAATATLAAGGIAAAAVVGPGDEPRARLALENDRPLFAAHNAANLLPGDTRSACMSIANAGDAPGRAALYAPGLTGELAEFLTLTVTRGSRPARIRSGSCEGFAANRTTYGIAGPGVVYHGRLSDFPTRLADALLDPSRWPPGDRHAYRFELALDDDPAAEGLTASRDWQMAVESIAAPRPQAPAASSSGAPATIVAAAPSASTPRSCGRLQLAGAGSGRNRVLTRTVKVSKRVRAVLIMRTFGSAAAPRVSITTGLRVRGDKTLLTTGWARVRYRLNGGKVTVANKRPFRAQLGAASFQPGRNRLSVAVQKRGRRAKGLAAFPLAVTSTTIGGRPVCVLSS